jgi:hypothetical protein
MKKNSSFKTTFYFGLIILLFIGLVVSLIVVNVYRALEPKFTKDKNKVEIYIDDVTPEKEIIHDTVYIDKPTVKINNTPKNVTTVTPKSLPVTQSEKDTDNVTKSIITDTIK